MPRLAFPFLALVALPVAASADWPQFRGPSAQGHADKADPPVTWGPKENVRWRTPVAGSGWSSPVVAGGRVYVTTAVPQSEEKKASQSLRALCLDAATGAVLWDVEVSLQDGKDAPAIHSKNSHASPTPLVDGDRVYVHFGHMGTACLSTRDGAKLWETRELRYAPVHGNGGSPVLTHNKLVFSIDGADKQQVVALDASTGKVAWATPRDSRPAKPFSFGTPLVVPVAGKDQLVSVGSDVVQGFEPDTGKEVWRVKFSGYSIVPRPVAGHGMVYFSTGYDSPVLYAVKTGGTGDVTKSHVAWTAKTGAPRNASPLLIGDALYCVTDGGLLTCFDAKTGATRWDQNVKGAHSASPVYAGGRVYLLAEDGTGVVFKPGAEYEELARNRLEEKSQASYAVEGRALFARTAKAVYRLEGK
ncbi:MAG TPA: PQQ-binding-like beta-propeller repeat protein [Urbifossiella sp.]|nr:PQQ-binding-like beta-propeller repeat protein [Urbifossiella sp.]